MRARIREEDVMREADTGMMWGHEPRSAGSLQKLDKARN